MQKSIMSYFKGSFAFTAAAVVICYFLGGVPAAVIAMILGVLETSLSVDNAVVNAKILKDMDAIWKKRFLTWGMVIAVFGMRIVFPILIVWLTSPMSFMESLVLPFKDAKMYAEAVTAAHISIAGFGGTFLLMVFLSFFMDGDKEEHWVPGFEKGLAWFSIKKDNPSIILNLSYLAVFAAFIVGGIAMFLHNPAEHTQFVHSAFWGGVTYVAVQLLGEFFEEPDAGVSAAKAGLASFMYLEVLDASFSFDGVIGAFALSNNIIIIALGLGIGAMFVRSLTILMVDKDTLGQFKYLEHGAFWSIGVLAACMFIGTFQHITEVVVGLSAAAILAAAIVHSVIEQKREAA